MPSAANPKLEKQASTEAVDNTPIRQAIVVIEHKIRNLEKRKGKLEGYRDLQKSGKELNADQKVAVAKYDEVINTIEFARELIKSFGVISTASEKEAKKLARKETLQRVQQNVQNIRELLVIQDILSELGAEEVRSQFLAGENGAAVLTEDDFALLDKLYEEITPKREEAKEPFNVLVQRSSEHILAIIEGKSKEAFGRTYASVRDLLKTIENCEYFNQNKSEIANDDVVLEESENAETENNVEEIGTSESPQPTTDMSAVTVEAQTTPAIEPQQLAHEHNVVPVLPAQATTMVPQVNMASVPRTAVNAEAPAPNAVPAPAFPPPQHQQLTSNMQPLPAQVIPQVPPGIVPVVATPLANPAMPHLPTVQSVEHAYFAQQQFIQQQQQQQQPRPITEMIGSNAGFYFLQESEIDSPEVPPSVSGPQLVSGAPRNTPPPPGHTSSGGPQQPGPIPTQTYTNQTFTAVPPMAAVFSGHPVPPPQQVPVPELAQHIPGFANPNQPIPIPIPQQPTIVQAQAVATSATQPPQPSIVPQAQFSIQPASVTTPFNNAQQPQTVQPIVVNASPKNHQSQTKPEEESSSGDVPESSDWCQTEPEPTPPATTNAWHNRQHNQAPREIAQESGSNDWANDTNTQEQWSGQGDGHRGGFRGRGGRVGNRGGNSFRGRGSNTGGGNYREQNGGGARAASGGTYYRNNDQQNSYYQTQNGGSNYNNREGGYQGGYQGGFKSRGGARGSTRGSNPPRPGQRTGQAGGNVNTRGSNRGGANNTQYVRREHATAAKQ